jgi:hypothetical protein
MSRLTLIFSAIAILTITGCVSIPSGPSVMVLPGTGLSFEQFSNDNAVCQQYASLQVGGTSANQAAINSGATSGAASTSMYEVQERYDAAYIQCMYAKGHQVPVSGQFSYQSSRRAAPPASQIPPPPPGSPKPPPPRQQP